MRRAILILILSLTPLVLVGCGESTNGDMSGSDSERAVAAAEPYPFDTPPSLTQSVDPVYPDYARRKGIEGDVKVKVLVGLDGAVEGAEVIASTDPVFEQSAIAAIAEFRFQPARLDGKATKSHVMIPVRFRLN